MNANTKKIIYIANGRFPTEKAHGIQIAKMCETFAEDGLRVELIVPRRKNPIISDVFEYYNLKKNFKVIYLPCIDFAKYGRFGFYVQWFSFAFLAFWYNVFRQADIFYFRDEVSLFLLSFFKRTAVEVHDIPESFVSVYYFFIRRADFVISTNTWKRDHLILHGRVSPTKIIVAQNGIDIQEFEIKESKDAIRTRLKLSLNKKIVLYVGNLYQWKGVDVLAEASRYLPEDAQVIFVGGAKKDRDSFFLRHPETKIEVIQHKQHKEIPPYLKTADVVVLPNVSSSYESIYGTSPLKMFEYMASGVPIVASNLPSIQEVLNNKNAYLVSPGDVRELVSGIMMILNDKILANNISQRARNDVRQYTWTVRARRILQFITHDGTR